MGYFLKEKGLCAERMTDFGAGRPNYIPIGQLAKNPTAAYV